jgi:transcriptional regulator with XRE-family HTH domain
MCQISSIWRIVDKVDFNKKFGLYVRQMRLNKGWTQAQLGDKISADYQYISSLERGEFAPTVYWVYNLTVALEMTFKDFMVGYHNFLHLD